MTSVAAPRCRWLAGRAWLATLVLVLALAAADARAAWDGHKVLEISSTQAPVAAGTRISALRAAVIRDGVFAPVPFQVDEYNEAGLVWFAATGVPARGKEGLFDGDDRLLVLAGDLSTESLPAGAAVPAGYLGELAVSVRGETRYLQLLSGEFPRLDTPYVRHDVATGITETPFYTLKVDPANELNWKHLMVRGWRGDPEQSLVDTLKMRISGGVFTPMTRLTLDNDNLRPKIVGVRSGPVRSTMQLETAVVVAGVTVMRMQVQVVRYPRYFQAFTHARIPALYRKALIDPRVRVTVDGNRLEGSVIRTARGGALQAVVDGKLDATEGQLIARGLSSDEDWLLFDTRKGFAMLTFLHVPADLRGIPLELVYQDNAKLADKPERFRGQFPNIGYGIRGFPPGEDFRFGVTLGFDEGIGQVDPRSYVARWRELPVYRFRPVTATAATASAAAP